MTAKRDGSRDVFVVTKFGKPLRVYPGDTQIIDSPDGAEECAHYALGSQYVALEAENASLLEFARRVEGMKLWELNNDLRREARDLIAKVTQ